MGELQKRVKEYIEERKDKEKKYSQAAFAKQAGINESTFSLWLRETYTGNVEEIDRSVLNFFERIEERKKVITVKDIPFAMTTNAKGVWKTLDYCETTKSFVCIHGDSGCGKTSTIKEWIKGKNNAVFITAAPFNSTPKSVLEDISEKLRIDYQGTINRQAKGIIGKLSGTDKVIIVDEAQFLNHDSIETLRSIQDISETGLALVGSDELMPKVTTYKKKRCAQLANRKFFERIVLNDFVELEDIYKIFGAIPEGVAELLLKVAKSDRATRTAAFLYVNSLNNGNATEKGLKAMAREMGIHL